MDNSILYDNPKMIRKFLQTKYMIKDEPFIVSKFEAREGDYYTIKVERNDLTEFLGFETATRKHSYLCVDNNDYIKWKKIYLRKYKLIKIKNNVKIQ